MSEEVYQIEQYNDPLIWDSRKCASFIGNDLKAFEIKIVLNDNFVSEGRL